MHQLVQYSLSDGQTVLVETAEPVIPPAGGRSDAGGQRQVSQIITEATLGFGAVVQSIGDFTYQIQDKIKEMTDSASTVSVSFSIKLSATAGVIIASGSAEANLNITVTWNMSGK